MGDLQIKCDWKHVFPDFINSKVEQLHFSEKIHQFFETFLIPDWSHLDFEGIGNSILSDALKSRLEQVDFERKWAQLHVKSDEIQTGTRGFGKIVASHFYKSIQAKFELTRIFKKRVSAIHENKNELT